SRRVSTGELNRIVDAIRQYQPPRASRGKTPKVYYATQVGVCPPTIVFFVNEPKLFDRPYRRYVEGALREALSLDEVPVRCLFRRRESKYAEES
ncbi:MAG: ribosome biogenesis GTPase Der, partial [Planctomycetota bacterium]